MIVVNLTEIVDRNVVKKKKWMKRIHTANSKSFVINKCVVLLQFKERKTKESISKLSKNQERLQTKR